KAIDNHIPSQVDASVRSYMSGHILHVHPVQSQTTSVPEQQYQLYLSMKAYPQLQQQDNINLYEITLVASPTGLCGLVPYTGSDSDSPDEMSSPEHISPLPAISPFICTDSSEAPDSSDGLSLLVGGAGLASRHAPPRSLDHHSSSSSSSSDSSPVHSLGLDALDQAHSGSSTRDVSPRLCYPPRRAPRCSEAFHRWCAAPLSTLYPPTTSESSSGNSSERPMHLSSHSAGPSRKRCRSPVDSAPLSMTVMRSLAPTRTDLSPPRKRFRDSYSSEVDLELGIGDEDEVGDHVGIDHRDARVDTEEYEADANAR
ncbi:hypothetical protein Tco_0021601, partial [Tanacetum coccineum]